MGYVDESEYHTQLASLRERKERQVKAACSASSSVPSSLPRRSLRSQTTSLNCPKSGLSFSVCSATFCCECGPPHFSGVVCCGCLHPPVPVISLLRLDDRFSGGCSRSSSSTVSSAADSACIGFQMPPSLHCGSSVHSAARSSGHRHSPALTSHGYSSRYHSQLPLSTRKSSPQDSQCVARDR